MRIAVLFDGAGLARLGLEQAGHECVGVELNPVVHYLGQFVGSGNCILGDARDFDVSEFDAVWASPPCQQRSEARNGNPLNGYYADDLLAWSMQIEAPILWVENVTLQSKEGNDWGLTVNAAQFTKVPIQCRNRIIGGRYPKPHFFRDYKRYYKEFNIPPTITANEWKGA